MDKMVVGNEVQEAINPVGQGGPGFRFLLVCLFPQECAGIQNRIGKAIIGGVSDQICFASQSAIFPRFKQGAELAANLHAQGFPDFNILGYPPLAVLTKEGNPYQFRPPDAPALWSDPKSQQVADDRETVMIKTNSSS